MVTHAKTARTFYDDARLAVMRANLERHEWARDLRRGYVKEAEAWAAREDAFLRGMVIPPQVPRCYDLHNLGCPVHGLEANKNGLYTWGYSIDRPFKIKCPAGGEEYPSNDFATYLASGMKDRSLLTGDYADDGWGWNKRGDNHNYWFVAYYAHWSMQRELQRALRALSMGALVAEDPAQARRFAHKCAVLLWQLATYYPDYDYNKQGREAKEHNPHYTGRITNMIWEVGWADVCAPAYDAIWPFLREDRELQALAGLDGPGLDNFIRDRLLMTMARDITSSNGRNQGNYGMHQQALIRLALALDEQTASPTSAEMVNWVLANPRPRTNSDYGLVDALENMVYRDGVPLESPGYNYLWTNAPAGIASALGDKGKHLLAHPRFRALLKWHYETIVAGKFQPPLGDSGDMFARPGSPSDTVLRLAVELLRDPRAAADLRNHVDRPGDLFTDPPAQMLQGSPEAPPPAVPARSHVLSGYGLGFLEAGAPGRLTGLALHYGSWGHHMHRDQLALLLFAHDNALLCDVGYPEQTDAFNHRRYGIWGNTISHNTVTVDAHGQRRGEGRLHAFATRGFAQVVDASCDSYEGVSLYRRATTLVEAAPEQSYAFDVFHVRGGRQHDWALMGPQADFSCSPPLGPVQEQGTLAGVDVPYEQFYDDPALKGKPLGSTACNGYNGSGFQFFVHVQRAALRGEAVAEWKLTAPRPGQPTRPWQGLGVRTHVVGTDEELIAADCQPQRYQRMPEWVKHLIRRRTGQDLRSAFVSVHEPYAGSPWIESVTAVPVMPSDGEAVAVMVRLKSGERHYCFHSLAPGRRYVVDGKLRVDGQAACLVLDASGRPQRAMLLNGTALTYGKLSLKGSGLRHSRLKRVDYAGGVLELTDPIAGKDLTPGQTVIVRTKGSSETVTLQKVLSPTQFSIGDEDLRVAGGPVNEVVADKNRIVSSVSYAPHAREGMTVLNSRGEIQGRLAGGDQFTLDRTGLPRLAAACFPAGSDGLGARFAVVIAGPGDEVILPSLTLYQARPPKP
ncbi:heparinase II/III-family protein [bacterium]|nr:heparinase II/III-family protein [bacterium]